METQATWDKSIHSDLDKYVQSLRFSGGTDFVIYFLEFEGLTPIKALIIYKKPY